MVRSKSSQTQRHPHAYDEPLDERTLSQVLNETAREHWEGRRSYATVMSQATIAIRTLRSRSQIAKSRAVRVTKSKPLPSVGKFKFSIDTLNETDPALLSCKINDRDPASPFQMLFRDVDKVVVLDAVSQWKAQGASPTSINARLAALCVMGIDVKGCRVRAPRKLKWWLTPDLYEELKAHYAPDSLLMQYVEWVTFTGLRVEEVLRIKRSDFSGNFANLTVAGTKTLCAHATLPLSSDACELAKKVFATKPAQADPKRRPIDHLMFDIEYTDLLGLWHEAMDKIGVTHPTATPKALRRGAARHLHAQKGMPLDMLRQYLRHSNVQTTMGYLRLTGGYDQEEMRKWLT